MTEGGRHEAARFRPSGLAQKRKIVLHPRPTTLAKPDFTSLHFTLNQYKSAAGDLREQAVGAQQLDEPTDARRLTTMRTPIPGRRAVKLPGQLAVAHAVQVMLAA
jgi:hypothetical protein